MVVVVHIAVPNQMEENVIGGLLADFHRLAVGKPYALALEVCGGNLGRAVVEDIANAVLQILDEGGVVLAGDDRQAVDAVNILAQTVRIHANQVVVYANAQPASHLLPLLDGALGVPQGANLEDVGVVPALAQGGMGENETDMPIFPGEADQQVLPFHDEFVGRHVIAGVSSPLDLAVDRLSRLLVNAEVSRVGVVGLNFAEVTLIRVIGIQSEVFIEYPDIFFLEDSAILPKRFLAVGIVLAIFRHLVDKE